MMSRKHTTKDHRLRTWSWVGRLSLVFALLLSSLGQLAPLLAPAAQAAAPAAALAATNTLTLNVISARTEPRAFGGTGVVKGDAITDYTYIINVDNTGTNEQRGSADGCSPSSPGYPASCHWTSIAGVPGSSPIYTQGNQDDIANGLTLDIGRYLISVMADGYKVDGEHFTVPMNGPITVALQPHPLPDATIRAFVFADNSITNGAPDAPVEQGLAGFVGHITDYLGEVSTDIYGNPLCTVYEGEDPVTHEIPDSALDADMLPVVQTMGSICVSDANGDLVIPHLGTNRYALSAVPPNGQGWIQTTTLEGNHDWDSWIMEGNTGYDTEFVVAGEPFPAVFFGYVKPKTLPTGPSGQIKGVVDAVKVYVPPKGGLDYIYGGFAGTKLDQPIDKPWLSLADLDNGDTAVYIGHGDANGAFDIPNVPDGNYTLTWWDEPQNYILDWTNVTVSNGEVVDVGILPLAGWWTKFEGYVFNDLNRNGARDPGEPGIPNFGLTMRKRENSLMDRGSTAVSTDATGYYKFENGYPMTQWLVMEAYNDAFYTTGVTYQADNQDTPTTVKGAGVDVSVLPIIGLGGRMDWGVHAYDPTGASCNPAGSYTNCLDPRNGGIVGTVSYDTTRNELDPQYAAVEDWQPGISGLRVNLYATVICGTTSAPCDPTERYELAPDGSYAKGNLLNTYVTEYWGRPAGCTARDVDGNPLANPADQQVLPLDPAAECLEGPLMGVQFGTYAEDQGTPDANFGAAVDGNYGFGDGCLTGTLDATDPASPTCTTQFDPLPGARDYLVEVEIPNDASGNPMFKLTREEDINIANGDQIIPQVPPPACAGPLHTVDVAGLGTDGYPEANPVAGITVPPSTPTDNPTFIDLAGSPYEGMQKPLCDTKLVRLNNGKSIVPTFNLFTDVPIPGRYWGLAVDDLNFSSDPRSLLYGEKAGIPFAPVGIYDFANRLVTTVESDFNGLFDVLLPSTNRISCPTPSGVCANVYRFVGNDPGIPGHLNPNYNPQFRTIAAEFEAFPGLLVPADVAPTQVGVVVQLPGGQTQAPVTCALDPATPQIFAVSQPYANVTGNTTRTFTINGLGFGAGKGAGQVTLDGSVLPTTGIWNDTQIVVTVPRNTAAGPHQLMVKANNGQSTINGLTFHILKNDGPTAGRYFPNLYEVGPGKPFATIQAAIDAAAASSGNDLVVVYPGQPDLANPRNNPRGAYYENLIITSPIKLQGVGPGGFQGTTFVAGSIIDGGAFGGDTVLADAWRAKIASLIDGEGNPTWQGNPNINDGQTIYLLALTQTQYGSAYKASIDGFDLRGADQQGFPGNINEIGGGPTGLPPNVVTQGGAIFANAYVRNLQITNNVVQNNGGSYGTIRIGTPDLPQPDTNQHNENVRIANNRIIANGGTNLAGGIGLFAGSDNYEVSANDICGNFSAEYGGGVSVYGLSPNGQIHHNRIYFNRSYDEGGGIMIAGELPANPATLSPGSGAANIFNNLIQANQANDDGGGLRFLMPGNFAFNVYNNMIVNNISTHEGGGIGINDAPNVRLYNNTIMKNITTATAVTSNGSPAPAGLSTSANSDPLQATLPGGIAGCGTGGNAPCYSNPVLFNNIFWDNRAGTRAGATVTGIGITGDASPINYWDLGVADVTGLLAPTNSIIQQDTGTHPYTTGPSNSTANPAVVAPYDVSVAFAPWRNNPNYVGAIMIAVDLPPNQMGDYHLNLCPGSPACNLGASSKGSVNAPTTDFDNQTRPSLGGIDSGADEYPGAIADLSITKTDGQTIVNAGAALNYTIVVADAGPSAVTGAAVTDNFPAALTVGSWSCVATAGSSCSATGTGNARSGTVTLLNGGSATFTANTTLAANATGSLANTASVAAPAGTSDTNTANNSATDTDTIGVALPTLTVLDNFNRANSTTLNNGTNWSQTVLAGSASIRVNNNVAFAALFGAAYWNNPTAGFGPTQGAAFTFAQNPMNGSSLLLKVSGTPFLGVPPNFIRVRYNSGQVIVETTTSGGLAYNQLGTFAAAFANGDTLTAMANTDGSVDVWRTTAANVTTYVGHSATSSFTGSAQIGMQLPSGARVDNFKGGTISTIVVASFPQSALLDSFTTANGSLGSSWAGDTSAKNFLIKAQRVESQAKSGAIWWNQSIAGANQEAYLNLVTILKSQPGATRWQGLLLKLNGGGLDDANTSAIDVRYATATGVQVRTKAAGQGWVVQAQWPNISFKQGNQFGAQVRADGTVTVFKNGVAVGSVNLTSGPNPWPATHVNAGGRIGVTYNYIGGRFDNFGGGEMTPETATAAALAAASSMASSEALGLAAEADVSVGELGEEDESDAIGGDEGAIYSLFLPAVSASSAENAQNQPPASAPSESEAAGGQDPAQYLPMVSNQ